MKFRFRILLSRNAIIWNKIVLSCKKTIIFICTNTFHSNLFPYIHTILAKGVFINFIYVSKYASWLWHIFSQIKFIADDFIWPNITFRKNLPSHFFHILYSRQGKGCEGNYRCPSYMNCINRCTCIYMRDLVGKDIRNMIRIYTVMYINLQISAHLYVHLYAHTYIIFFRLYS